MLFYYKYITTIEIMYFLLYVRNGDRKVVLCSSHVDKTTFINWVPAAAAVPLQFRKADVAMEVAVTGIVTFTQPQQAMQLQYNCPSAYSNIFFNW